MSRERPILFSAPMVRALLDGRKTQTRRVLKRQPIVSRSNPPRFSDTEPGDLFVCPDIIPTDGSGGWVFAECESRGSFHCMGRDVFAKKHCPYGQPGDRLWVRETWGEAFYGAGNVADTSVLFYRATPDTNSLPTGMGCKWRPSIHMPRWASRITLEVTGVRLERLNSISEADALAEGIEPTNTPIGDYALLWDSINGAGAWAANPFVWCVEFRRIESTRAAA